MSQPGALENSVSLSLPQPPTAPTPVISTQESTSIGGNTFSNTVESAASSDYGSDFSPDEEELLNLLLARIGERHERTSVISGSGSGSPSAFATPALSPLEVSSDPDGGGIESAVAAIDVSEASVDFHFQSLSLPPVTDIEDHAGISRDRVPRVLGRAKWCSISQRA
ncbi:hypothetical protein ACJ73_01750, partial [Blastomyces percursus]